MPVGATKKKKRSSVAKHNIRGTNKSLYKLQGFAPSQFNSSSFVKAIQKPAAELFTRTFLKIRQRIISGNATSMYNNIYVR